MAALKDRLRTDLTTAMKARDVVRTRTLRSALTAVSTAEVAGATSRELSDDEVINVLAREAKRRREAADAFATAGRAEQAAAERAEGDVLDGYLPAQLSDDELVSIVAAGISESGASGPRAMGQVMKVVTPKIAGRADGARVAAEVRRQLSAQAGDLQVGPGLAGRVLVPAAERGFDPAGAGSWAALPVQAGQDRTADVAGQAAGFAGDVAGAGDQGLGGFGGDLVAGPVGVGVRHGLDGVGDGDPQCLIQRQQRPHLLFQASLFASAQHPALEQGVPQREVGNLVFPALIVERDQRLRRGRRGDRAGWWPAGSCRRIWCRRPARPGSGSAARCRRREHRWRIPWRSVPSGFSPAHGAAFPRCAGPRCAG